MTILSLVGRGSINLHAAQREECSPARQFLTGCNKALNVASKIGTFQVENGFDLIGIERSVKNIKFYRMRPASNRVVITTLNNFPSLSRRPENCTPYPPDALKGFFEIYKYSQSPMFSNSPLLHAARNKLLNTSLFEFRFCSSIRLGKNAPTLNAFHRFLEFKKWLQFGLCVFFYKKSNI